MTLKTGLEERVKGLALEKADIIFVKEPHLFTRLANCKFEVDRKISLIMVNDFGDITSLNEDEMKKHGWVKEKLPEPLDLDVVAEVLDEAT
jgi:hypothetical protein